MDKKKIIALAAGTLVAGVLSSQGLQAMTDYCDYGSGSDIRTQLLEAEGAAPVSIDDVIVGCKDGKCPRPKRPEEGKKKQSRYNWRSVTADSDEGKTDEGHCGEGHCGQKGNGNGKKPMEDKDKSDEGRCGEGSCG
jgi:uncharacterized low-complexity protein